MGGGGHRRRRRLPARLRPNRRDDHRPGVTALPPHESHRHARHELRRGADGDVLVHQDDERRHRPRGDQAKAASVSVLALAGGGVFRHGGVFGGPCARTAGSEGWGRCWEWGEERGGGGGLDQWNGLALLPLMDLSYAVLRSSGMFHCLPVVMFSLDHMSMNVRCVWG